MSQSDFGSSRLERSETTSVYLLVERRQSSKQAFVVPFVLKKEVVMV